MHSIRNKASSKKVSQDMIKVKHQKTLSKEKNNMKTHIEAK